MIVRLADGGAVCRATAIAAISPVWLDCSGPGTQIFLFKGWPSETHIPAPQMASWRPLWRHDPSVKIVIGAVGAS